MKNTKKDKQMEGMNEVERLARGCVDLVLDNARESVNKGEKVAICFPAEEYRMVVIDGITYQMKVSFELFTEEEWNKK